MKFCFGVRHDSEVQIMRFSRIFSFGVGVASKLRHKQSWATTRLRALFSGVVLAIVLQSSVAVGQNQTLPASEVWSKIQQSDARLNPSQITWKHLHVKVANSGISGDEIVERAVAQSASRGEPEDVQKEVAQSARQSAEQASAGSTYTGVLSIARSGSVMRCEVIQDAPVSGAPSSPKPKTPSLQAHYVDFYDGKNLVMLEAVNSGDAPTPLQGELTRPPKAALMHTLPDDYYALFLMGAAVTDVFPASTTTIESTQNGNVVLQRRTQQQLSNGASVPVVLRSTISAQFWRPLDLELLYPNENNRPRRRYQASDYQVQSNGAWFPLQVTVAHLYGRGYQISKGRRATDADFNAKDTYTLVKATFGEQADVSSLNLPIPRGTTIGDSRFGPTKSVRYRVMTGVLPGDDAVLRMVKEQEKEKAQEAEAQRQQQRRQYFLFALPLGALISGLGVLLWVRSRRLGKS